MSSKPHVPTMSETARDTARHDAEQAQRARDLIALLESWCSGDEADAEEQRETWEYLKRALDEDRLSDRKLFP